MEIELDVDDSFSEFESEIEDEIPGSEGNSSSSEDELPAVDDVWRKIDGNGQEDDFQSFNFNGESGPNHDLPETATACDYFSLFWGNEVFDFLVAETNR